MDTATLTHWRDTIQRILRELAAIPFSDSANMSSRTVFDTASDNYVLIEEGWQGKKRLHGVLVHVEIKNGKIWIQQDGTEHGIANDLVAAGIGKDRIVLGFKYPERRKYSEFAVS